MVRNVQSYADAIRSLVYNVCACKNLTSTRWHRIYRQTRLRRGIAALTLEGETRANLSGRDPSDANPLHVAPHLRVFPDNILAFLAK